MNGFFEPRLAPVDRPLSQSGKPQRTAPHLHEPATDRFDPAIDDRDAAPRSGVRRTVEPAAGVLPWLWPTERKAQYRAFDDWHDVAMQIVHRAGAGFRLMAVYKKVMRWNEGCIWNSDAELALEAGRCSWKTISREIRLHRALGIIAIELGWRVVHGKRWRTRTIRLAVPAVLDQEIVVRDLQGHTDISGPHGDRIDTVHSGPNHTVHRGLITIDGIEGGAGGNVSA
ncbi:hypothetical protein [Rhizobium lentis]|uniref:hypothetical protein n=1 Tax=Rhizobium lentis TaxID=1138194 RepID=UPI001C838A12|nr:hypothetical protein [Rhizobium lentis]MBX5034237.1 hypothetical protein [Rhizobium lentis]